MTINQLKIYIMPNYQLEVNQVEVNGCNEKMFVEFFSIDADFSENEEYFREDTLELGFENEAERCSKELFEKFKDKFYEGAYQEVLEEALEEAGDTSFEGTQHIIGNGSYTSQSEIIVICIDEEENNYIAVVSRMSY